MLGDVHGIWVQNKSAVGANEAQGYRRKLTCSRIFGMASAGVLTYESSSGKNNPIAVSYLVIP